MSLSKNNGVSPKLKASAARAAGSLLSAEAAAAPNRTDRRERTATGVIIDAQRLIFTLKSRTLAKRLFGKLTNTGAGAALAGELRRLLRRQPESVSLSQCVVMLSSLIGVR
jgi:hypothetical protein